MRTSAHLPGWSSFLRTLLLLAAASGGLPCGFGHGDIDERIAALTGEIAANPQSAELYLHRGQMHHMHRDSKAAAADYNQAEKLNPELAEVDLARGELLTEDGRFAEAKAALDRYLTRRPAYAAGYIARARALVRAGDDAAAAEDFAKAAAIAPEPDPTLFIEGARALEKAGAVDDALRVLDKAVARRGPLVVLLQTALEMEEAHGRSAAALTRIDQLLAGAVRKERWLARKGAVLEKAGRSAEARECFLAAEKALAAVPPARRTSAAMTDLSRQIATALGRLQP